MNMKSLAAIASLTLLVCAGAGAQEYPSRPITIYVPFAAGGGTDLSIRMLEDAVSKNLGQKVVIVNKTGTATIHQVVTGTPDGYTLVVGSSGNTALLPHNPGVPYERSDYIPVVQITNVPSLLVAPANSPFSGLADVIATARKNPPGFIKMGISPIGSISHLAGIQLEKAFKIKFTYIPHKSNGDVMTAVLGGHVDLGSVDVAAAGARIRANAVRGLALYRAERLPEFPELRTVKEQGADITFGFYNVVLAPKGTPERIVTTIHDAFRKALEDPAVLERSRANYLAIAYLGPKESRQMIDRTYDTFGALMTELGLKK